MVARIVVCPEPSSHPPLTTPASHAHARLLFLTDADQLSHELGLPCAGLLFAFAKRLRRRRIAAVVNLDLNLNLVLYPYANHSSHAPRATE